jgi:hypothetical protein
VKLDKAIEDVQEAEAELARLLRATAERHAAEADVYHLGHTLARGCAEQVRALEPFAPRYGATVAPDDVADESPGLLETLRRKGSDLVAHSALSGQLLLRDLRRLYLAAQDAEIAWVILAQGARAARDAELIDAACHCAEQAAVRAKWLRTKIKEASPQVLAAG